VALNTGGYPGALGQSSYYSRTTFFLVTTTTAAPEVQTYEVSKARKWVQTSNALVSPETGQEFVFDATAQSYLTGVLTTGTVQLAPTTNPPSRNLMLQPGGTRLDFSDIASTQGLLDAFYGSGSYTLNFGTSNSGSHSVVLSLPADNFHRLPEYPI